MSRRSKSPATNPLFYTLFSTPLGKMGIAGTRKGVCRIAHDMGGERDFLNLLKAGHHPAPIKNRKPFVSLIKQFDLYFAGKLKRFELKADLSQGTEVQQSVWRKLTKIPFSKTRSYQWVAEAIKNPKAVRAVGNANGKNPLPIVIPCHRVIQQNNRLGGYTGGLHIKQFLLDLENSTHAII